MTNKQIADAYHMRYPERTGGVIIIYGSHVAAWNEDLPPASDWEPGCFAVDEDGREWVAVGGQPQDGADRWQLVENPTDKKSLSVAPGSCAQNPHTCPSNIGGTCQIHLSPCNGTGWALAAREG